MMSVTEGMAVSPDEGQEKVGGRSASTECKVAGQ